MAVPRRRLRLDQPRPTPPRRESEANPIRSRPLARAAQHAVDEARSRPPLLARGAARRVVPTLRCLWRCVAVAFGSPTYRGAGDERCLQLRAGVVCVVCCMVTLVSVPVYLTALRRTVS